MQALRRHAKVVRHPSGYPRSTAFLKSLSGVKPSNNADCSLIEGVPRRVTLTRNHDGVQYSTSPERESACRRFAAPTAVFLEGRVLFRLKTRDAPIDRAGSVTAFGHSGLIGSHGDPVPLGRFLLVSVGFHLLAALAVMTASLHPAVLPEQSLVVRFVEAEAPRLSPSATQSGRGRPAEQTTAPRSTDLPRPRPLAEPKVGLPAVSRPEPEPAREMIGQGAPHEPRLMASQRATEELLKDLGLSGQMPSLGVQNAAGKGISGPKGVGAPSQVTLVAGNVGGREAQADPAIAGEGSEGLGLEGSRGRVTSGVPGTLIPILPRPSGRGGGRTGVDGGPKRVEGGATAAIRSRGLSSGPALVEGEPEGVGLGGSPGNAQRGLPKSLLSLSSIAPGLTLGRVGGSGGPRAIDGGAPVAVSSRGLSSGPALLGDEEEEASPALGGPGGGRRLRSVFTAPLAPTVTVGSRQGVGGSGARGGSHGADGQFAAPNYGTNPLPSYPPLARERGYQGTAYLRVQIQPNGRVGKLAIDRSSGYEILDRAALDSVRAWTFLPARKNGKPVQSWVLLPVEFKIE